MAKKELYLTRHKPGLVPVIAEKLELYNNEFCFYKGEYGKWFLLDYATGISIGFARTRKGLLENLYSLSGLLDDFKLNRNAKYVELIKEYNKEKDLYNQELGALINDTK